MTEYAIILEPTRTGYSAYSPDVPGCVATGRTPGETKRRMRSALQSHLESLREDGLTIPEPATIIDYVAVKAK